jgi:hypothetical protein
MEDLAANFFTASNMPLPHAAPAAIPFAIANAKTTKSADGTAVDVFHAAADCCTEMTGPTQVVYRPQTLDQLLQVEYGV